MARPPSAAAAVGPAVLGLVSRAGFLPCVSSETLVALRQGRAAGLLEQQDLFLLAHDHGPLRTHDLLAVAVERIGVDRRIGHDDPVFFARARELEDREDVVVDLAAVGVEESAADAGDRQRVLLAQEDRTGIELVAPQFGHQAGSGAVVKPPVDQLVQAVVAVFLVVDVLVQVVMDSLPAVAIDGLSFLVVDELGEPGLGVVDRIAVLVLGEQAAGRCCGARGPGCGECRPARRS